MKQYYLSRGLAPKHVLLPFEIEDAELFSQLMEQQYKRKPHLRVPQRGDNVRLVELACKNAFEEAQQATSRDEKYLANVNLLGKMLVLPTPRRIESYDISNFGNEHLTAGMIVFKEGAPSKRDYRTFKIKSVKGTTDDYASMREALTRRFNHLADEQGSFAEYPDLILLDGGRGHVGVAREVLNEIGLDIPVFGMVKDDFHKTRALCTEDGEINIAKETAVFQLIYAIQEEVHRYTITAMKKAKGKTLTTSSLTKIPGIGPAKAAALLKMPGGLAAVKRASREELMQVKGIGGKDADAILAYFKEKR